MSAAATRVPALARPSATARPMPEPAPVTTAVGAVMGIPLVLVARRFPGFPRCLLRGERPAEQLPRDDELGDLGGAVADLQPDHVPQPLALRVLCRVPGMAEGEQCLA